MEPIEVAVDASKPSDNMDNLHELHQLKERIIETLSCFERSQTNVSLKNSKILTFKILTLKVIFVT